MTIRRILGKEGRTTIPFAIRSLMRLSDYDVISFSSSEDRKSIIITKEKICDGCMGEDPEIDERELFDLVDELPTYIQEALFSKLSMKYRLKNGLVKKVKAHG